jgi:hypothetical protein
MIWKASASRFLALSLLFRLRLCRQLVRDGAARGWPPRFRHVFLIREFRPYGVSAEFAFGPATPYVERAVKTSVWRVVLQNGCFFKR